MRRITVKLTQPTTEVPVNNQHQLNGFIHASFGKNNPYHDSFSNYNISSLQGGKLNADKKTISFPNGNPYFYISGDDKFIGFAIDSFMNSKASMFGMVFESIDITDDFVVNSRFDNIITISPILLRDKNGKRLTFKDEKWVEILTENCVKKLEHNNICDPTFKIEIINPHKAKEKCVWVGNVFNKSTMIRLKVFGKPNTRRHLYNMGLGHSTGSGFGSIKIYQ